MCVCCVYVGCRGRCSVVVCGFVVIVVVCSWLAHVSQCCYTTSLVLWESCLKRPVALPAAGGPGCHSMFTERAQCRWGFPSCRDGSDWLSGSLACMLSV